MAEPPLRRGDRSAPWWAAPDPVGWRVALPAVAALFVQVFAVFRSLPRDWMRELSRGDLPGRDGDVGVALVVAIAGPLLLLAARVAPGPVVAAVTGVSVVGVVAGDDAGRIPPAALAVAVVSAVARGARVWAWASLAGGLVALLVLSPVIEDEPTVGQLVVAGVVLVVAFGAGEVIRTARVRRVEAEEADERRRGTALRTERERIARELHDVLAHSLSQISVQAGVGLHLSDPGKPESLVRAREALANIRQVSGTALDDVRGVIATLRDPAEAPLAPEPDLHGIPDLLATVRGAGIEPVLRWELVDGAEAVVPRTVQAAAYRIVQEALTNVARHSGAASVAVRVVAEGPALRVEVTDDGDGRRVPSGGGGLGIAGMTERAQLAGGSLSAGPLPDGGWRVAAVLPFGAAVAG